MGHRNIDQDLRTTASPEFAGLIVDAASPKVTLKDADCTDSDDNATIEAAATDTGTGTEDVDVVLKQQIAGVLTAWLTADADGDVAFGTGRNVVISGNASRNYACAGAYVSSAAATGTITAGTPVNLFANSTISATDLTPVDFTVDDTAKNIKYTGVATKKFVVRAVVSMTSSLSNQTAIFYISKNGTPIAGSKQQRKIGTGSDLGNASVQWGVSLDTNETVSVYCDLSVNGTITPNNCVITVTEAG